ncbi:hypothetical protein L3X38_037544 [Prunus dulcis]|uniref:Uncharacterized protein n=1 Tax=Prunus dulcis TaxID=3755 RepID=A0AAD4V5Q9_PRUDU|nr:hypothetical protein L3X38_037544 [Prunus dulcis]
MAPKKDKHKESASQPKPSQSQPSQTPSMSQNKPELPKQMVPYPGCTPLTVATPLSVANRFSSLGSTVGQIRPSYQSILVASYDPFSVDIPAGPSVAFKKSSPYLPKSNSHLFVIEPLYDVHTNPVEIAKHYFPPDSITCPPVLTNTRFHGSSNGPTESPKTPESLPANFLLNAGTNLKFTELPIEGKSKSELQEIARQLILQASQMDDDEDNDSPASSSCQPLQNPVKPK